MKKNITIIILAAGVILLLYFLLYDPKQPDSHKAEYEQAQADLKAVREQRNAGLRKIDSLEKGIAKRDTFIAELRTELSVRRRDLDKSTAKAVQLAKEIKELQGQDKSDKCDSLAIEAENFAFLYNAYKTYVDSLTSTTNKSISDYQAALNEQKRLYNELFEKFEQLNKLYKNIYKDYSRVQKTVRRERLKTKIAALLALISGAAAVLK